jgi:hypothetical protein
VSTTPFVRCPTASNLTASLPNMVPEPPAYMRGADQLPPRNVPRRAPLRVRMCQRLASVAALLTVPRVIVVTYVLVIAVLGVQLLGPSMAMPHVDIEHALIGTDSDSSTLLVNDQQP